MSGYIYILENTRLTGAEIPPALTGKEKNDIIKLENINFVSFQFYEITAEKREAAQMSREYRQVLEQNYEATIETLLSTAPSYVREFYNHMHHGTREITTQLSYIRDVIDFLSYEKSVLPEMQNKALLDFPEDILSSFTLQDINEYRNYLFNERKLTNPSAKKKLAALSAFFKYLCLNETITVNPMTNFEYPVINKKRIVKLDAELSQRLLNGILENNKYLATSEYGEFIVDIPPEVWIKRERAVLRNYAITYLFLGAGLRISELVGLDLSDISFRNNSVNVILKGGDETQVYFSDEVADALRLYVNGPPLPPALASEYSPVSETADWAKAHICDPNLNSSILKKFPKASANEIKNIKDLVSHYRRQGRNGYNPQKNCNAVFLSNRGTRITVRMVELMLKEMVKTYLPDYDDKDIFSPHKLRATCATRILSQTGDIELASTQLNHKGVAVTAAFYAELQKEKRKDKIKNLDVNDW